MPKSLSIVPKLAAGPARPYLFAVPDRPKLAAVPDVPVEEIGVTASTLAEAAAVNETTVNDADGNQTSVADDATAASNTTAGETTAAGETATSNTTAPRDTSAPRETTVTSDTRLGEIAVSRLGETAVSETTMIGVSTVAYDARSAGDLPAPAHRPPVATKLCAEGHPNNAYGQSCRVCGRRFLGASEIVIMSPISVGRLLMEDGWAVQVADALVIGRHPAGDSGMDTLTVTGSQVSRRHLLLEVKGWDLTVTDCDSTNGTFLTRRGERGRRRVPPGVALPVRIGDSIHFGARQALVVTGTG